MKRWHWILLIGLGLLIIALPVVLAVSAIVYGKRQIEKISEIVTNFEFSAAMLGFKAGDTIPAEGLVIEEVSQGGKSVKFLVPVVLYPNSKVMGSTITTTGVEDKVFDRTAIIILSTADSEEEVLEYYMKAWEQYGPKSGKPGLMAPSLIYPDKERVVKVVAISHDEYSSLGASISTERGSDIQPMKEREFNEFLHGKGEDFSMVPEGEEVTIIWLDTTLWVEGVASLEHNDPNDSSNITE